MPNLTHNDEGETLALDHPAEGESRPSLWARFAARFRADETPAPGTTPPVDPRPKAETRAARPTPGPVVQSTAARRIAFALAGLLTVVIVVAFRGSWTAHSDAAKAAHFDDWGAFLYPFAPDGLIVLALVGAVVLRHKRWPSWYCLGVVTLFTLSSYTINHLHGLGTFLLDAQDENVLKPLEKHVVGLIAAQLVGAIAFGSHILMHVFRHLFPEALDVHTGTAVSQATETAGPGEMSDPQAGQSEPEAPEVDRYEFAKLIYGTCLDAGVKLSQDRLHRLTGISKRKAGYVQVDVDNERAEAEEPITPEIRQRVTAMRHEALMNPEALIVNGSGSASGPRGGAA